MRCQYNSLLIDDAAIYRAADADFGKVEEADKVRLAQELTAEFRKALGAHAYQLTGHGLGINTAKSAAASHRR